MNTPITEQQRYLLEQYRDKTQIMGLLASSSYEYFSLLNSLIKIPIILSSSVMALLNSSVIDEGLLKYCNIILNSATALILSLSSNFKVEEKSNSYKILSIKFTKLHHEIENVLINDTAELDTEKIQQIISNYDGLCENIEPFAKHIKRKIIKKYSGKKSLPNCLLVDETNSISNRNTPQPSISGEIVNPI